MGRRATKKAMAKRTFTLKSSDDRKFKVGLEVAMMLNDPIIQMCIDVKNPCDLDLDESFMGTAQIKELKRGVIPLPSVTGNVLEKVLEWAEHEVQKDKNAHDNRINRFTGMTDWEEDYLRDGLKLMPDVSKTAADWDIRGLLDLYFKFVANWLRGRLHVDVPDILMYQVGRVLKTTWGGDAQAQLPGARGHLVLPREEIVLRNPNY